MRGMRLRRRSSVSGEFVSSMVAADNPDTTTTERVKATPPVNAFARVLVDALAENHDVDLISLPSQAAYTYLREALGMTASGLLGSS